MYVWNDIALIEDDSHFTVWVKEAGRLDHHRSFLERVRPYLRGTVIEVGANVGTHTVFYAQHAERVIAFEPLMQAYGCLVYNTAKMSNVELLNFAAGKGFGVVGLVTPEKNYGASFTVPSPLEGKAVPVRSIDSLGLTDCGYIKIDAEGDEIDVLVGARETIAKFEPVMCIECNRSTLSRKGLSHEDLLDCIEKLGYSIQDYRDDVCCDLICIPN